MAKAYTYNTYSDSLLSHIWTDDGGSFSANRVSDTAFDYFPDDAAVDDAIYFCDDEYWRNLKLYVGTAFVANSVTFVWEYWNGSAWTALSNVVDNTNGFTVLGENTVTWDIPTDWIPKDINGVKERMAIRCRISAIDTPTEGGAQSTQKVEAGDNKIVVTGGTSGDRITIKNIYDESMSQGWGVVERVANILSRAWYYTNWYVPIYVCSAKIEIGDGTNQDYFALYTGTYERANLYMNGNGNYISFKKTDVTLGTSGGIMTRLFNQPQGYDTAALPFVSGGSTITADTFELIFSSRMSFDNVTLTGAHTFTDCIIGGFNQVAIKISGATFIRTYFRRTVQVSGACTFSNLFLDISSFGATTSVDIDTFEFLSGSGRFNISGWQAIVNAINGTGVTSVYFNNINQTLNLKYDFDLKVVDNNGNGISGATVVINDVDGNEVFNGTTDGNGDITQQQLVWKTVYSGDVGKGTHSINEMDTKTPHTITISKSGYKTRVIKYTMDRKREEVEKLSPDGTDLTDVVLYDSTIY